MAARALVRARLDERRRDARADVDRERAAVDEAAAFGRVDRRRRRALAHGDLLALADAGSGTAASSSCVYGWSGSDSTCSAGPCSTIWPAYMTRMSSAM